MEYREILRYLKVALESLQQRYGTAQQTHDAMKQRFRSGTASTTEVQESSYRPRELQVEIARVESLLKLYRGIRDADKHLAYDTPQVFTLKLDFEVEKMGKGTWVLGGDAVKTTSEGNFLHLPYGGNAEMRYGGFEGHKDAVVIMKVETQESALEALKRRGVNQPIDFTPPTLKVLASEFADVIAGKPTRRFYVLKPNLEVVEVFLEDDNTKTGIGKEDIVLAIVDLKKA